MLLHETVMLLLPLMGMSGFFAGNVGWMAKIGFSQPILGTCSGIGTLE
jgi:hypothetical protein